MTTGRVILHLDLDCFYCQVEQKRLGIPREVPAAVQQWDGLIAINYAARALGVTRHMRVIQAMQKCPELQCLHVQTLGGETGQEGLDGPVNSGSTHPNDRLLHKACLERYRKASAEIIAVIRQLIPQAILEKASIDEVYVDVTPLVEKELMEREDAAVSEHAVTDAFAWGSIVEGGPLDTESELDRRLSVGASISCRVRGAIREKLHFTSSVGIAHNKLLAKVGSARNKPDQQTIVTSRGISALMEDLPLRKLRNFGGKLGTELQALGATTVGQVAALPFSQLQQHFGERATFICNAVRGIDDEPVKVRELTKSMLAYKSFEGTSDLAALNRWLGILADELSERLATESQINQRIPRLLVLGYRQRGTPASKSKSIPMPKAPLPGPSSAMLQQAAYDVLQKCTDALPCNNLGLTATEFQELPGDEQGCITRFFQPKLTAEKPPQVTDGTEHKSHKSQPSVPARALKPVENKRKTINSLFKKVKDPPERAQSSGAPHQPSSDSAASDGASRDRTAAPGMLARASPTDSLTRKGHAAPSGREQSLRGQDLPGKRAELSSGGAEQQSTDGFIPNEHLLDIEDRRDKAREPMAKTSCADPSTCPTSSPGKAEEGAKPHDAAMDGGARGQLDAQSARDDSTPVDRSADERQRSSGRHAQSSVAGRPGSRPSKACESPKPGERSSPGQADGAIGIGEGEQGPRKEATASEREMADNDDNYFEGVDMKEQKRIMHEIWVRNNIRHGDKSPKKSARKPQMSFSKAAKQPRLTDMFCKRQ